MKKVAFMAPETKGGPYYLYKDIVEQLQKTYGDELDVRFFNTKKDWIKLHFQKYDTIFSVIPFLFKPLGTKQFIYNIHGNFETEKHRKGIGTKLLYLSKYNLRISDKIMLNSFFLADKLKFREKYKEKIIITPNHIKVNIENLTPKKLTNKKKIKILTVSSTKFLEKGMGIVDLGKQLAKINDKNIERTIVAGGDKNNKNTIEKEFKKIKFSKNIKISWIGRVTQNSLVKYYKNADIFLYGTRLDTRGLTIMEAMSYGLPVILLEYELRKYIYPKSIITKNIHQKINDVIEDYENQSKVSIDFIKSHPDITFIGHTLFKLLRSTK